MLVTAAEEFAWNNGCAGLRSPVATIGRMRMPFTRQLVTAKTAEDL
jgi:hypothetical protein